MMCECNKSLMCSKVKPFITPKFDNHGEEVEHMLWLFLRIECKQYIWNFGQTLLDGFDIDMNELYKFRS